MPVILTDEDDVVSILKKYAFDEDSKSILFECKFSTEKLILLYLFVLDEQNVSSICNSQVILNIVCLIRTYNTFDDSFFTDKLTFFNDIEQYIDVKTALRASILKVLHTISEYYLSMLSCIGKNEDLTFVCLPTFFNKFFLTTDMIVLSEILASVPVNSSYDLKDIKGSLQCICKLAKEYAICYDLADIYNKKADK